MPLVPVPIVGQTYESKTTAISNQVSRNLYPEININTRAQTALQSWPGNKFIAQGAGKCRGMFSWAGVLYKVTGNKLERYSSTGVKTEIGVISGSGRCVFDAILSTMVITTGGDKYTSDGNSVSIFTDTFIGNADTVAQINNTFIYDNGGDNDNWSISVAGAPATGFADASLESRADSLLRPYAFRQVLYLFGTDSIEPWLNTGTGQIGFQRVEQGVTQLGCGAKYSVANTDNFVYFVGSDHLVYQLIQYQTKNISTIGIAHFLENNVVSDAVGYTLTIEGQNIYMLILPTANKTLCYSEENQTWFELSSGVQGDRSRISSYAYCYDKHWIGDKDNGSLFQLDLNTYQDNGEEYKRERITAPINGETLGQPGASLLCKSLHLTMRTGVGKITGDVNPSIVFQYSIDDGQSWSGEHWVKLGRLNETTRVRFDHMITAREIRYRMYVTDDCDVSIHSAALDVETVETI